MNEASAPPYLERGGKSRSARNGARASPPVIWSAEHFPDSRRPDSGHRQSSPPLHVAGGQLPVPKGVVS